MSNLIEGFLGKSVEGKKSRMPAKLDYWQSATGLFLALFMWGHLFFTSTILISKDFMYSVTKMFEGSWFLEKENPYIVSILVAIVLIVFIIHAMLGMRKMPSTYRQYQVFKTHMGMIKHEDTTLWYIQVITGFSMFFLGSTHLIIMLTAPDKIGPFASADSLVSDLMWPIMLLLLFAVEVHGAIGLYRLSEKWGWFDGKNPRETRKNLKKAMWGIMIFTILLGLTSLGAYIKIGLAHRDQAGQRYQPTAQVQMMKNIKTGENMNYETSFRSYNAMSFSEISFQKMGV